MLHQGSLGNAGTKLLQGWAQSPTDCQVATWCIVTNSSSFPGDEGGQYYAVVETSVAWTRVGIKARPFWCGHAGKTNWDRCSGMSNWHYCCLTDILNV